MAKLTLSAQMLSIRIAFHIIRHSNDWLLFRIPFLSIGEIGLSIDHVIVWRLLFT